MNNFLVFVAGLRKAYFGGLKFDFLDIFLVQFQQRIYYFFANKAGLLTHY